MYVIFIRNLRIWRLGPAGHYDEVGRRHIFGCSHELCTRNRQKNNKPTTCRSAHVILGEML